MYGIICVWVTEHSCGEARGEMTATTRRQNQGIAILFHRSPPKSARLFVRTSGPHTKSVEPALGHDPRLAVVLLLGEALDVVEKHLRVGGQNRAVNMSARIPKLRADQRLG